MPCVDMATVKNFFIFHMLKKINYLMIFCDNCQKATETLSMGRGTSIAHEILQVTYQNPSSILTWSSLGRGFLDLFSRKTRSWGCSCCCRWVMSDSLWPHGLQHTRLPCPSLSPGVCSNSCPLSRWCHPTISSSITPFSCPQSFPGGAEGGVIGYRWSKDTNFRLWDKKSTGMYCTI